MTRGLGTLLLTPAPTCVLSAVVEAGEGMEKSVAIEIPVDFVLCILYLDMHFNSFYLGYLHVRLKYNIHLLNNNIEFG